MPITDEPLEAVTDALRQVYDPEIGLDIVAMGLVYRLEFEGDRLKFDMTLTTPGCPVSETLPQMAHEAAVEALGPGSEDRIDFQIVWEPPWCPDRIDPEALERLGY